MDQVVYFQGYRPAETAAGDANQRLIANVHPPDWQNPRPTGKYNLVVVGGGSAGLVAAIGAAGLGAKVALIERHLLGGDCLNVGCVPSKTVIRSAKVLGEIARSSQLGVQVDGVHVDFSAVMERMRRVRADLSEHDSVQRVTKLGIDMYLGDAHFTGSNTLEIDGQTLSFAKAVIATGSRPAAPPIPGLAETGHLTNEKVWDLTLLPPRLAVIGAGPIGAELAQA
ncbi:MAG: FAD-dependent oxidoreductase, partial [Caldilinea sp.]